MVSSQYFFFCKGDRTK